MLVTITWIRNKYNKFNKLYFDNKLPKTLEFKITRSKDTWGYAALHIDYKTNEVTPTYLALSNYYDSPEHVKENTLLHEMIHILDYVTNPEHYVIEGSPNRYYNAHGTWFKSEALKLKKYGYDIQPKITQEEENISERSEKETKRLEAKKEKTLVCEVIGIDKVWFCKTDVNQLKKVLKLTKKYNWWLETIVGTLLEIRVYKTTDEEYAEMRSCSTQLRGWSKSYEDFEKMSKKRNFNLVKKSVIK